MNPKKREKVMRKGKNSIWKCITWNRAVIPIIVVVVVGHLIARQSSCFIHKPTFETPATIEQLPAMIRNALSSSSHASRVVRERGKTLRVDVLSLDKGADGRMKWRV